MNVQEVMTSHPACGAPAQSAAEAAKLMKSQNVGSLPVCETRDGKRLLGIVTDHDLAIKVLAEGRDPKNTRLEEIMTRHPITCHESDDLENVLNAMQRNQIRRIPVVDEKDQLIGIVAQADIALRGKEPQKTARVVSEISKPSRAA
jgi:CBS domain-containing protein